MGREIVYCEGCGISLREVDFEKGKAREIDHRNYCVACRPPESPSGSGVPKIVPQKSSSTRNPVPTGTTPRRPTPAVPARSNVALIAGIGAGVLALIVVVAVASSGSGHPRESSDEKPPPPPPPAPRAAAAASPSEPAPARRTAPAELRDPQALKAPTDQEKSARFDSFVAQIRTMIDQDKTAQRRAEIEGMIAAVEKSAGARPADVQALRAHHAKAFDESSKAACEAARKDAERLWAEKKYDEAFSRVAEIPEAFHETRPVQELRKWVEEQEKRRVEAEARDREAEAKKREEALARFRAWKIDSTGSEESGFLPSHRGRSHVYQTHPHSREKPCSLERAIDVPAGKKTVLSFWVAPDAKGDWELRAYADGKELLKQPVGPPGADWKRVELNLTPYAGKRTVIRLENAATDWAWEFGYWADLEVRSE